MGAANRDLDLDTTIDACNRNRNPGRQTKPIQAAWIGGIEKALARSAQRLKILGENQTLINVLLASGKICSKNQGAREN
jgi:hypothetical protein